MKLTCVFFLVLAFVLDLFFVSPSATNKHLEILEASVDNHLVYIIITAAALGIIKLKKNPG